MVMDEISKVVQQLQSQEDDAQTIFGVSSDCCEVEQTCQSALAHIQGNLTLHTA